LNVVTLSLPAGDQVRIALHGAHVLSWQTADGQERLYLSPKALQDGHSPIRGGVPVCFPQFNQRVLGDAPLPKHGFARTLPWTLDSQQADVSHAQARLFLTDTPATKALWPHGFAASLDVSLRAGSLQISFTVRNTSDQAWPFALALHTYLRVANIAESALHGLHGQRYWDAVANLKNPGVLDTQTTNPVRFTQETDRVYDAAAQALRLVQPGQPDVVISQSANMTDTVVWNPGEPLCATMADMPPDGFRHMLCVEAARINAPVVLQPGESWTGWQQLSVA
jgi:glucose-6-phosphate 1-epimerase